MQLIQGELFKQIKGVDYFHTHEADFTTLKTNKIVTHNSDWSTSKALEINNNKDIFYNNEDLIWFAQNVDIKHPRIYSIPIGLENSEWFPETQKIKTMQQAIQEFNGEKIYPCIAIFNSSTHQRRLDILEYYYSMPWCLTSSSINDGRSFNSYIIKLVKSAFCVCPRGNGIDTHRLWEALYCKSIPIVERCINIEFYENKLPIFVVDDLTKVTNTMLYDIYQQFMKTNWQWEMLYMDYWEKTIYEN